MLYVVIDEYQSCIGDAKIFNDYGKAQLYKFMEITDFYKDWQHYEDDWEFGEYEFNLHIFKVEEVE